MPGSGQGVPPQRPDATRELPARARSGHVHRAGDEQQPRQRAGRRSAAALRVGWALALLATTGGLVTLRVIEGPELAQQGVAVALALVLAVGLAVRAGGPVLLAVVVTVGLGAGAVATQWLPLLAGAAVATGVLAACLAVLGSRPAASFRLVTLEVLLAHLVAGAGALGAAGFTRDLSGERLAYTVLALAFVSTVALVYRLGGGLHSLGKRGLILVGAAAVLLVVVVVYTAALTRYGSPDLVIQVRSAEAWALEHLGGIPTPAAMLIGVPALAWGVSMRSRRRQGWWACAFGTAATASVTARLAEPTDTLAAAALGAGYGIVVGLVLAYLLIRVETLLTGRAVIAGVVHRDEPGRLRALH